MNAQGRITGRQGTGLGWFPSISSGLNWCAGQLRLPLATAAMNSRMRLDLYLSGGSQTLNLFVANFSVPERQVSFLLDHIPYFYQEPWYRPPAGNPTSVGSPLHLASFAFFLTASLPPVALWALLSPCICVILWRGEVVMVTAVLLLAIRVTRALPCLPQFPCDQGCPPLALAIVTQVGTASCLHVPIWAIESFAMCQLLIQLQL